MKKILGLLIGVALVGIGACAHEKSNEQSAGVGGSENVCPPAHKCPPKESKGTGGSGNLTPSGAADGGSAQPGVGGAGAGGGGGG